MDNKPRKLNKNVKRIIYALLIVFSSLYITSKTGYYEKNMQKKAIITKEAIKEFEKDVSEGKDVKLKDYIDTEPQNFNNRYSNLGLKISTAIDKVFNDGTGYVLKIIKTLFS